MATGAAVAVVASTVVQIDASRKAAKARARALRARADGKRQQAEELLKRNEFNIEQQEMAAEEFKGSQIVGFAKAGVALGTGVTLAALEDTQTRLDRAIQISREEAEFKANQLLAGADIDTRLASDVRSAERRERLGIFLGGAKQTIDTGVFEKQKGKD